MSIIFIIIVAFLLTAAIIDLFVGVSNDAVNFMNSAIGSKAARYRTIVIVAAIGVFAGAAISNGMIDIARHGIMTPTYFSFYDVMCVFLAVMITDILLLDLFNTLGLPTSTTVSMVFELLGGAFAIAIVKVVKAIPDPNGMVHSMGEYINTDKALSVILGIFMSVAIAFVLGSIIQWIVRVIFSFTHSKHTSIKTIIFSGLSATIIIWFLLINGLKNSTIMTPQLSHFLSANSLILIGGGVVAFSAVMALLQAFKVNVLKVVVLMGTFSLAMAFAGNDLVNFVGVPLTGLESYLDYAKNGMGDYNNFMMDSLTRSAQTSPLFTIASGVIMVVSLFLSKKALNVSKTEVGLSSYKEGDEMFGSSGVARTLVRTASRTATFIYKVVPRPVGTWVNNRFNKDNSASTPGAAYDLLRACVNLVVSGLLVTLATSYKLPLSTTYVTFMVAMGAAMADRAWSRESAVFRITGILSVIGGWFITAGIAFTVCFIITSILFFCGFSAMIILVFAGVIVMIYNNRRYRNKQQKHAKDTTFITMLNTSDRQEAWEMLQKHVRTTSIEGLTYVINSYSKITDGFFKNDYRQLRRAVSSLKDEHDFLKRMRRREIIGLRKIDPHIAIERNTWFFLQNNALRQMLYCLKRTGDPCRDHVGNNFSPLNTNQIESLTKTRQQVMELLNLTLDLMRSDKTDGALEASAQQMRGKAKQLQHDIATERKELLNALNASEVKIEPLIVSINILQESREIISCLRHLLTGISNLQSD